MKKNLVILAILKCAWLCAQHNYKSTYRAGLKLGYSWHTLSGDLTESRASGDFIAGLWVQLKMNKKWTAQTELLLLDKGIGVRGTRQTPHFVSLHYVEVPVLFQYHRKMTYFEFGPGLSYLINYREHLYGDDTPNLVNTYPFARSEISFNAGIGFNLNEKWTFGFRLNHSLVPVRRAVPSVSKQSYNRLIAVNITRQIKLKKKKVADQQE